MEDRFAQIGREFNENRDLYYRKQLQNFQNGIDAIRHADLYANKALDDFHEDTTDEATTSAAVSTHGSLRTMNSIGSTKFDIPWKSGPYAKFSHSINDAMEQRDAELTTVAVLMSSLQPITLPLHPGTRVLRKFTDGRLASIDTTPASRNS